MNRTSNTEDLGYFDLAVVRQAIQDEEAQIRELDAAGAHVLAGVRRRFIEMVKEKLQLGDES